MNFRNWGGLKTILEPGCSSSTTLFPTVFDAIRAAQASRRSPFSKVQVTRRQAASAGRRIRTNLDFLSLITTETKANIRLFDGDVVSVAKSPGSSAATAQSRPNQPDTAVHAGVCKWARAQCRHPAPGFFGAGDRPTGGTKLLHGKVEFIRFTREGEIDRRVFGFKMMLPS